MTFEFEVDPDDCKYIKEWANKAQFYEKIGIYDNIIDFIGPIKPATKAIEFGVGVGSLLEKLANNGATCVGVDNKLTALEATAQRLEGQGHKVELYAWRGPVLENNVLKEAWHPHPCAQTLFQDNAVTLIADDYMQAAVLEYLMQKYEQPAELITLSLTGGIAVDARKVSAKRAVDIANNEFINVIAGGIVSANKLLQPGGRLIFIDKGFRNGISVNHTKEALQNNLEPLKKTMEVGRVAVLDISQRYLENANAYVQSPNWKYAIDIPDVLLARTDIKPQVNLVLAEIIKK